MTGHGARLTRRGFLAAGVAGLTGAATATRLCGARPAVAGVADAELVAAPAYFDPSRLGPARRMTAEVCVYGATSAGVAAAVAAARAGRRTVLLAFSDHVGGMTTGGVSTTDVGDPASIGGLAAEFYRAVGAAYGHAGPVYDFEPHVAAAVTAGLLRRAGVTVLTGQPVARVTRSGTAITSLVTVAGSRLTAAQFVDASTEGDLLAAAGVEWRTGREPNAWHHETLNGYRPARAGAGFTRRVDPYRVPGRPAAGLLAGVAAPAHRPAGTGDGAGMAAGFRLCITRAADRIPFPRPAGWRAADWDLAARALAAGEWDELGFRVALPHGKFDLNARGGISTDAVGLGHAWAGADYEGRQAVFDRHLAYDQGLLWFLGHDPRVAPGIRAAMGRYGLAADEWRSTGGWPPELYVREARRMVNDRVMTQWHTTGAEVVADPVALASYKIDCHPCQRTVVAGVATDEGILSVPVARPYGVALGSLLPRRAECTNLAVAAAVAATHVAWSSIRMEPVFMMLGQAAGTVAALAADGAVQDLPYPAVAAALRTGGALLGPGPT